MQQIVDLQNSPEFQDLNVQVVSIARDSIAEMAPESVNLNPDYFAYVRRYLEERKL